MKHLFLFLLLGLPMIVCAQLEPEPDPNSEDLLSTNYVYLFDGWLITGNQVTFHDRFLRKSYIAIDGEQFDIGRVKFFQDDYGLYANPSAFLLTNEFATRISAGKINLYELERENNYSNYDPVMGFTYNRSKRIDNFYNIGFGNLKKANYQNLSFDLKDSPVAMSYLNQYKKQTNIQTGLYVLSGVFIAGGIYSFLSSNGNTTTSQVLLFGCASASGWVAYFVGLDKPRHLKDAIDAYNTF